jgi:hypothetical protein
LLESAGRRLAPSPRYLHSGVNAAADLSLPWGLIAASREACYLLLDYVHRNNRDSSHTDAIHSYEGNDVHNRPAGALAPPPRSRGRIATVAKSLALIAASALVLIALLAALAGSALGET